MIDKGAEVLSEQEIARAGKIKNERNHREYLAAHILTRRMLSHFSDIPATDWHFDAGKHGRPEPASAMKHTGLRFNLSHANGMVACAVTLDHDIGVDVEWLERSNRFDEIAMRKFAPSEVACFQSASDEERRKTFFSFWTLKESYIKAIGKGLIEPLDGFAFDLDTLSIAFLKDNGDEDCWGFDLFQPSPQHLCALSLARTAGAQFDISRRSFNWDDLTKIEGNG